MKKTNSIFVPVKISNWRTSKDVIEGDNWICHKVVKVPNANTAYLPCSGEKFSQMSILSFYNGNFKYLPDYLVEMIFKCFRVKDVLNVSLSCKDYKNIWEKFYPEYGRYAVFALYRNNFCGFLFKTVCLKNIVQSVPHQTGRDITNIKNSLIIPRVGFYFNFYTIKEGDIEFSVVVMDIGIYYIVICYENNFYTFRFSSLVELVKNSNGAKIDKFFTTKRQNGRKRVYIIPELQRDVTLFCSTLSSATFFETLTSRYNENDEIEKQIYTKVLKKFFDIVEFVKTLKYKW